MNADETADVPVDDQDKRMSLVQDRAQTGDQPPAQRTQPVEGGRAAPRRCHGDRLVAAGKIEPRQRRCNRRRDRCFIDVAV